MKFGVTRFLPRLLCKWYTANPNQIHVNSRHSGILLFADTSGFTALTRNLSLQGRVGFEHLTNLLDTLFRSLETVIIPHSGDFLKFSGDAVWCYFPEDVDIMRVYSEMLTQIEALNSAEKICHQFPLSLHAGVSTGTFDLISVQASNGRIEFEIVGKSILDVYRACDIAKAGEVCIFDSEHAGVKGEVATRMEGEFCVYAPIPEPVTSLRLTDMVTDTMPMDMEAISRYLPSDLLERMSDGSFDNSPQSEHRRVTVVFVNVQPQGKGDDAQTLSEYLAAIMNAVHDSRGVIARIDPFGGGHKVLALFGAIASTGSDTLYALQAAATIAGITSADFETRTGISLGPLLCGEVGSQYRREFTVMGNAVNLAARLMSKAAAQGVLMDKDFYTEVAAHCRVSIENLTLKGFDTLVPTYSFGSFEESAHRLPTPKQFYGRGDELTQIRSLIQQADSGDTAWLTISGNSGIGKTTLVAKAIESLDRSRIVYLDASSSRLRAGGWLIYELIRQAYGVSDWDQLASALHESGDQQWLPTIMRLSGKGLANDVDPLRDVPLDLKASRIAVVVARCLQDVLLRKIIVLDNLESLDTLSAAVLKNLGQELNAPHSLIVLVDISDNWAELNKTAFHISLAGLGHNDLNCWLSSVLSQGKRETDLANRIISTASGNPQLVSETLKFLIDSGTLAHISDGEKYDVATTLTDLTLSGQVEELQLARFDQLTEPQRSLLKAASIFQHEFTCTGVSRLLPNDANTKIELSELESLGLLTSHTHLGKSGARSYRFNYNAFQEAIYNRVPILQLQNWHLAVASSLHESTDNDVVYELAYHFSRTARIADAFKYCHLAATKAMNSGLPLESGNYFRTCEECLEKDIERAIPEIDRLRFYEAATGFYISEGNYLHARKVVRHWRRLAKASRNPVSQHASSNELARLFWKQSRYNRCRPALDVIERQFGGSGSIHLVDTFALQGELYRRTGKILQAQASCCKAVDLARSLGDAGRLANALNNLGLAYWSAGTLEEATRSFEATLNLHENNNAEYLEARVANNLGIVLEEQGDFIRARTLVERARTIFAEFGDRRNQSYASGNLANLQVHAGRYREAIDLFNTADRIFLHLGESHPHYYTIGNLADIDLILGKTTEAASKYNSVLEYARSCNDRELEAETSVRLAECAFYGAGSDDVREKYVAAIGLAKEADSLEYQIRGTVGLCRYLIGIRDAAATANELKRLDDFAAAGKSIRNHFEATFLRGELERVSGRPKAAVDFYLQSQDYARKQEQFELLLKSLVRLSELSSDSSNSFRGELAALLQRFAGWNGEDMLDQLLLSDYYKYFSITLGRALGSTCVASNQHTVA